jgi:aspartyl-tRNA(Asn)/glutamyl-tRNA(Gln) amidotransferase subunit C
MALHREEVRHIAALARIELDPGEEERLVAELGRILGYVDRLREVELTPLPSPGDGVFEDDFRAGGLLEDDDEPAPCLPRERFLANAPQTRDGFLIVPGIKPP